MDLAQLKTALDQIGVSARRYSLSGGLPNGGFGVDHDDSGWTVYYSERGQRCYVLENYPSENDACHRLWNLITDGQPLPEDPRQAP